MALVLLIIKLSICKHVLNGHLGVIMGSAQCHGEMEPNREVGLVTVEFPVLNVLVKTCLTDIAILKSVLTGQNGPILTDVPLHVVPVYR